MTVLSVSNTFVGLGFTSDEPPRSRRLCELRGLGKADPSKAELVKDIRRETAKDN